MEEKIKKTEIIPKFGNRISIMNTIGKLNLILSNKERNIIYRLTLISGMIFLLISLIQILNLFLDIFETDDKIFAYIELFLFISLFQFLTLSFRFLKLFFISNLVSFLTLFFLLLSTLVILSIFFYNIVRLYLID